MNALRVAWLYFRVGAMNELQYRVNFFIYLFQSLLALGTGLVGLWLVFNNTSTLDGWTRWQLLVVMGVYTLMGGLIQGTIQPNMQRLLTEIQDGTLDYALTKPEDSQVLVSVREVHVWQSVDVLTGLVVLVLAITHLQSHLGVVSALGFVLVLALGAAMIYCFWLALTTVAFWVIKIDEIVELFQGVYAAGRYPIGIYPFWLRYSLTFLVPVAFAVTVPSEALTGRLNGETVLGTVVLTAALAVFTRWFWRMGVRRYSGASA